MNRKWLILGAAMIIQLCLGTLYAWSVFVNPLEAMYGWTRMQTQIVFSLNVATVALAVLFAGRWQDKVGPRRVIACGGILFGGGYLLAGFLSHGSFPVVAAGIGIISGIGSGLAYISVIATGIKWFPERKGLVTGLIVGGMGSGTIIIAGVASFLIGKLGILMTFSAFGVFFIISIPILSLVFENPPAFRMSTRMKNVTQKSREYKREIVPKQLARLPQFWLLWIMFVCGANAGLMVIGNLKPFGIYSGLTPMVAGAAVGILAFANSVGRVSLGWLSDRIGTRKTVLFMLLAQGIMMLALTRMGGSAITLAIASAWIGFNFGGNFSLFPSATAETFGAKNLGGNYGIMFTAYGVAGLIGPIVGGKIFDMTGSYEYAFIFAGILCFVGALLNLRSKKT